MSLWLHSCKYSLSWGFNMASLYMFSFLADTGRMATRPNYINIPLVSQSECIDAYQSITNITDDMLCAGSMEGGKDECSVSFWCHYLTNSCATSWRFLAYLYCLLFATQGDSGSPLMCSVDIEEHGTIRQQWYQIGIGSWNTGCGRVAHPGVYTRVSYFTKWIRHIINEYTCQIGKTCKPDLVHPHKRHHPHSQEVV